MDAVLAYYVYYGRKQAYFSSNQMRMGFTSCTGSLIQFPEDIFPLSKLLSAICSIEGSWETEDYNQKAGKEVSNVLL